MIEAIGIVIPAHDEEELLPACIASVEAARIALPTRIVVVLDDCSDASAEIAGKYGLAVMHRCVGRARAEGVAAVLGSFAEVPTDRLWLAMTDADSRVSPTWLQQQIEIANATGAIAIAGTVAVEDWGPYPDDRRASYESFYAAGDHIHGANLGVRADAYLAAGGFPAVATGEDVALWNALKALGPVLTTRSNPVTTSSRLTARAPDGFAAFLRDWAA